MSQGDCHDENRLELEVEEIERIERELLQIIHESAKEDDCHFMSQGDCHNENRLELKVEEIERIERELLQIIHELAKEDDCHR
ncbi:hypothetical protein [Pelosinus fermentans]|uniref:Uncharacterized protein n=1 Tax=Pelosinus fermentans JBW45 TaxID=1192197 RepID=I8TZS4_9FIRM|nr:hypothetical protein [Pelosinus fermentans]AJQ27558.1 hypothetical protein JBW_02212 [Pelosinus fermentans JBW45]